MGTPECGKARMPSSFSLKSSALTTRGSIYAGFSTMLAAHCRFQGQGTREETKKKLTNSRGDLKKRKILGDSIVPVVYDQARFILDADVHRCWASVGSKPIVYKNGSKESISIGGAYSLTGEFFFYSMKWQVKEGDLRKIKL